MTNDMSILLKEKIEALVAVPHCCPELKDIAKKYVESIGTSDEHENALALIKELDEDVVSIDSLIEFTTTDYANNLFGAEAAETMHNNALIAKENGEKYCICEACQAGKELILLKDEILNN